MAAHLRLLLVLALSISPGACTEQRQPLIIEFAAVFDDVPIHCESSGMALSDLRFFVSNLALTDRDGTTYPVPLLRDGQWQTRDLALIDLESGEGSCLNGTPAMNTAIRGTAAARDYVALSFTVGVPFELNHLNPLMAESPLNVAAMHWHWRSGYKFMRAGVATPADGFWLHLGSSGCQGTVGHITGCSAPNRAAVVVPLDVSWPTRVQIDLAELVRHEDLTDSTTGSCSSGPGEESCTHAFSAIGLSRPGEPDTAAQRVFEPWQ